MGAKSRWSGAHPSEGDGRESGARASEGGGFKSVAHGSEGDRRARGGGRVVFTDLVPVDHVEEGTDVLRAPVLVLEVVGVLPDVDAHDGHEAVAIHEGVVLVGSGDDRDGAVLGNREPGPSRTE